jgi:thymidylate synthase
LEPVDQQYQNLVTEIMMEGTNKPSRAGDTRSIFDYTMKFDLRDGFPLLSTKKIVFDNVYAELMWFLRGDSNIKTLRAPQLWKPWAKEDGDCGRIYGVQFRDWRNENGETTDQLQKLIETLGTNPNDRRMIVTAWNPGELEQMALPPCHMFFQCYVSDGYLDLSMWQRSCDVAIGVPYNIASYALLLMMLAKETNFIPRFFNHHLGDAHIYTHHFDGLKKQLARESKVMPRLFLDYKDCMLDAARRDSPDDYVLENYDPAPFIKFSLNV